MQRTLPLRFFFTSAPWHVRHLFFVAMVPRGLPPAQRHCCFLPTWCTFLMQAFENAVTVLMALGGSTNGVLHLLALAREAEVGIQDKHLTLPPPHFIRFYQVLLVL